MISYFLGREDRGGDSRKAPLTSALPAYQPVFGSAGTMTSQPHERTSHHATFRLRCAERSTPGMDCNYPVKLVVFDFDETISMVTFMAKDTDTPAERRILREINFETPWVEGDRLDKLRQLFQAIRKGQDGRQRALTILTKNSNKNGITGVLQLLSDADLDIYFDAIWIMPAKPGQHSGVYQDGGKWKFFDPPMGKVPQTKADVLFHVANHPKDWFPQMKNRNADAKRLQKLLTNLKMEGVVLVDDQRFNFQSEHHQILRYCKVARYDAEYRCVGLQKDMGGIGAHNDADYETLRRFVEDPWMCKENLQVRCSARALPPDQEKQPVKLVVFDFDETLTLATFMPKDQGCATKIGWTPNDASTPEWTLQDLVDFNFETPFASGSRVRRLQQVFKALIDMSNQCRVLAILTRNDSGAVAVLNLLKAARLDQFFAVIWNMQTRPDLPNGAYQVNGTWSTFVTPVAEVYDHKADVLADVANRPQAWFPQLTKCTHHKGYASGLGSLRPLAPENIVLVDDERANFRTDADRSAARVMRYCKVARYDENYRDCGLLNQMGGLGAHSEADYTTLVNFVEQPWNFPYEPSPGLVTAADEHLSAGHTREVENDDLRIRRPRVRAGMPSWLAMSG